MIRGFTLLEVIIAMALLSMCVIGFLQALNVSMVGTDRVRQTNYAVELTRSQMEYIQQQDFILHNDSEPSKYGNVSEIPPGWNASAISTTIYNVTDANGSPMDHRVLQEVVVEVTYSGGKTLEMRDYKSPREGSFVTSGSGWLVTSVIDIPLLPSAFQFLWWGGEYWGYYYTFETGTTTSEQGMISGLWQFTASAWFIFGVVGNPASVYLYRHSDVVDEFPGERGMIALKPADVPSGYLVKATSHLWGTGDREVTALESDPVDPGEYTLFFYNEGISILGLLGWSRDIYPSTATITYYK